MLEYRCRQLVELVFNMSTILLYDDRGWYCHQWTSVTVRATPARSPASIVPRSRTFYHGTRAPAGPPKWHNPPGLSPGCWVATCPVRWRWYSDATGMRWRHFAAVLTGRRRPRPMTPSTGNPASIVLMSSSRLDLHQALLVNSFRKRREFQFFSTRNAFITFLSSRVILPIKMPVIRNFFETIKTKTLISRPRPRLWISRPRPRPRPFLWCIPTEKHFSFSAVSENADEN